MDSRGSNSRPGLRPSTVDSRDYATKARAVVVLTRRLHRANFAFAFPREFSAPTIRRMHGPAILQIPSNIAHQLPMRTPVTINYADDYESADGTHRHFGSSNLIPLPPS
ncbi:hypothetical protein FRC20_002095 [Serendipita sp. 405]|nr:hypothetical protein FRC20_002095 [Serendipita sp. 405]